jgi:hypothetical protein
MREAYSMLMRHEKCTENYKILREETTWET